MEIGVIAPLLAFVILALFFLLFLRRAGRLVAAHREVERFRRQVADVSARAETSLGEICRRIDAVRRGQLSATTIADDLTASLDATARYADEARGIRAPRDSEALIRGIVGELERAARALEMVEHGCAIQASARAGSRELEAQTAIKRGYLNVLHAREAIARYSIEAASVVPADPDRRAARRSV